MNKQVSWNCELSAWRISWSMIILNATTCVSVYSISNNFQFPLCPDKTLEDTRRGFGQGHFNLSVSVGGPQEGSVHTGVEPLCRQCTPQYRTWHEGCCNYSADVFIYTNNLIIIYMNYEYFKFANQETKKKGMKATKLLKKNIVIRLLITCQRWSTWQAIKSFWRLLMLLNRDFR